MARAETRYVFHHIPKTGGSSALAVFRHWFNLVRDYEDPMRHLLYLQRPIDLNNLGPYDILCGHFCTPGSHLAERYPQLLKSRGIQLITLLRDPLDTIVSLYHYEQRVGYLSPDKALVDYLSDQPDNMISSYFPCNKSNYEEVLGRYRFIGLTERIQESFDYLADQLGKARILVPRVNAHEGQKASIPEHAVRRYRARNALDYQIYNHAVDNFPPAVVPYSMTFYPDDL